MGKDKAVPKEEGKKPASSGEEKKPGAPQQHGGTSSHASAAPKGASHAKLGCLAVSCKDKDSRANFCDEHFRQYKFGLITKFGEKVLDFEKKFEHYQRWLSSIGSKSKVA